MYGLQLTPTCKKCDVSLTIHKYQPLLNVTIVAILLNKIEHCAACGSPELTMLGIGTQKIEEELIKYLEMVLRLKEWTADITRKSFSKYNRPKFEQKETDILVGATDAE